MADRKKVIKTIDGCINDDSFCNKCDYDGCVFKHGSCEKDLLADALELLKEQEAVEPDSEHHLFVCPVCRSVLRRNQKFCNECGKRIEWKGRLS